MGELTNYNQQLPDTLEDLSRFVLVNEERIQALRAEIRAIQKVSLAKEVYEQKLAEAQEIGQITVEAAQKMGELLLQIQKQTGARTDLTSPTDAEKLKTKTQITEEMGMTSQQVSQYQQMAQNPEAVQAAIQKAIENGDVISRSQVMREIKAAKSALETELAMTKSDLIIAQNEVKALKEKPAKEVIKEVVKEVVPDDYEDWKRKAASFKKDFEYTKKAYDEMADKWKKAEQEKQSIQDAWAQEKNNPQEQMNRSALFFCAGISNFIEKYGGYVWLTEHINELAENERKGFISGINALDSWVRQMKTNMEGQYE